MYHPDKQAGVSESERDIAELKFKDVQESWEVLSDSHKKHLFDSGVNVDGSSASAGENHGHSHGNPFGGGGGMDMKYIDF